MNRRIYAQPVGDEVSVNGQNDYLVVTKKVSLKDRILLSPIVKFVLPTILVVACLMTAVYLTIYFVLKNEDDYWPSTCNIRASYHVECFPGKTNVTYQKCIEADCCWQEETDTCFHSIPSHHGYRPIADDTFVPRRSLSPFGRKNSESLIIAMKQHSDLNHVEIVLKISDSKVTTMKHLDKSRGTKSNSSSSQGIIAKDLEINDIPEKLINFLPEITERRKISRLENAAVSNVDVYIHSPEFSITVLRKNETYSYPILSTARGPLILTQNFWELSLYLTNSTLYGLNQLELNGTTNWIYDNENGSTKPAFLGINENGEAAACYVTNDGPMEIKVMNESNLVILRGVSLPKEISIHVFAGPTPLEAIQQLTKGLRSERSQPDKIETSSHGLHICPNGDGDKIIESMMKTIEAMKTDGTPWDSHCIHQGFDPTLGDTMDDNKINIVKEAMKLMIGEKGEERTLAPHLTPMTSELPTNMLGMALANASLLLKKGEAIYTGSYRKGSVVYPDWHDTKTHNVSLVYLKEYATNFQNPKLIFLRDVWPRDERGNNPVPDNSIFDFLPRNLQALMTNGTLPYNLKSTSRNGLHYSEHNSYGSRFKTFATQDALMALPLRGLWGESDNSSWSALREAIRSGVGSGFVGELPYPMYACGTGETLPSGDNSDELCSRWYGAAVTWPHVLALDTNLPGGKHVTGTSSTHISTHLKLRASLLTYARTLLAEYYSEGTPILAPTSVHYPNDPQARYKSDQFMWGYGILVGLVTLPKVKQVRMWIPGDQPWRHLSGGATVHPGMTSITAVEGHIVTLVKPGCIIPLHEEISTTSSLTLKGQLTLVINLYCEPFDCHASGKIFYGTIAGEGEFLNLSANQLSLNMKNVLKFRTVACTNERKEFFIKSINVLGDRVYDVQKNICDIACDDECELSFKTL